MGGGGWPSPPELVEATRQRLVAESKVTGAANVEDSVKESLLHLVDQTAAASCATIQNLMAYFNVNKNIVEALPCSVSHFGLCEQRDGAILQKSFALAKLLRNYTAKAIPKAQEGKVCFMFKSDLFVAFAFQGKVRRRPQWQGYVAHAIEDKELVPMTADAHSFPLLPVHRVQDFQMIVFINSL